MPNPDRMTVFIISEMIWNPDSPPDDLDERLSGLKGWCRDGRDLRVDSADGGHVHVRPGDTIALTIKGELLHIPAGVVRSSA